MSPSSFFILSITVSVNNLLLILEGRRCLSLSLERSVRHSHSPPAHPYYELGPMGMTKREVRGTER